MQLDTWKVKGVVPGRQAKWPNIAPVSQAKSPAGAGFPPQKIASCWLQNVSIHFQNLRKSRSKKIAGSCPFFLPQKWVTWERNHPPGTGISTEKHHFLGPLEWCIICTQLLGKSWKITVLISALWGSRSHCIPGYAHFLSHG